MDLRDILSPDKEIPRSTPSAPESPTQSPRKHVKRSQSGPLQKHGAATAASPLSQNMMKLASIPAHVLSPIHQPLSSPLISPVPTSNTPQTNRQSSTPMDALADLASLQNHQPAKPSMLRGRNSYESQGSNSYQTTLGTTLIVNPRASFDINMVDIPKQSVRTDFLGTSLSSGKQKRLEQLVVYIQEHPSAYESHIEIINILHNGFIDHIYPSSDPGARRDPNLYDLLPDLRNAREQMEKLFAVGESLWSDWLQDESILAHTAEARLSVVEKFRKAINEEVGSGKLWTAYGDWVQHCYSWAHDKSHDSTETGPDEERMVGRELFKRDMVEEVWEQAVENTTHNLAESHLTWNKQLEARVPNFQDKLSQDQVHWVLTMFQERLQTPHIHWDDTFQAFSGFVSANLESYYEELMSETNHNASSAKSKMAARSSFESAIEQAQADDDRDAEYTGFTRYIEWERTPEKRRKPDPQLVNALFQRAELRFPSDPTLWEEHAAYLIERSGPSSALLSTLERATKHCPWSGSLWSQCLLVSDRVGQSFQEVESIKHNATSTGLLEAAGIEEVVKVHAAWCSYLRRRSSSPNGSEEDIDVAEMGIRSSIENVSSLAATLGLVGVPDPSFQLQRIYITFLTESGRWDNARHEFDTLVRDYGYSYQFWLRFYQWEMMRWQRFAPTQREVDREQVSNVSSPHLATGVLKKALDQANLDYPEPIIQAFITHCEDHEDADELLQAHLKVHQVQKAVAARQLQEAAQVSQENVGETAIPSNGEISNVQGSKRKREDEADCAIEPGKKIRSEDPAHESVEQTPADQPKRDREHSTVLVQNLPDHISDTRIRQYFTNCGLIKSLQVLKEDDVSAIIEFEDDETAKYALSRNGQDLDGAILSVTLDTGSTLYLTNYKISADEAYIRGLLEEYGEIISIRFPSLQGNKRRRFCYVQFKLPSEAQAATELDGQMIDNLPIICKISDPAAKKNRENKSTVNDGRTIFVGQLNFKSTEKEVQKAFSHYGDIENIRVPLSEESQRRNRGIAFITFVSADSATNALSMNGKELKGRAIKVNIATSNSRQGSTVRTTASPAPVANGRTSSPAPQPGIDPQDLAPIRDRQVFLTNIPDTVNESRIQEAGSKHGKVLRVVLKTNHQGAIVEYSTISEAGEAALKLDGHEISPGRTIRVVTESEMKEMGREKMVDPLTSSSAGKKSKSTPSSSSAAPLIGFAAPIRRPGQPVARRGGLGSRHAPVFSAKKDANANATTKNNGNNNGDTLMQDGEQERAHDEKVNGAKKTNDDFRSMLANNQ